MTVHFSVDDVGNSLRWLNLMKSDNLFEANFFLNLKSLYDEYGVKTDLFVFELAEFLFLTQNQNLDFNVCGDFLRFGFHGNKIPFRKDANYVSEYLLFSQACEKHGIHQSSSIRLHNWYATDEQKRFFFEQGINCLLYPDDDCLKYDESDCFMHMGIKHKRTNVRIEHLVDITKESLLVGNKHIEIFTHEPYITSAWDKIRQCLEIYFQNGYTFI